MSNISHIGEAPLPSKTPSLDSVLQEMETWRSNRKPGMATTIPEELWHKIFSLADIHSPVKIRGIFGISTVQYNKKHAQLYPDVPQQIDNALTSNDFCEVKLAKPKVAPYQPLTIPATHTVIVEFCRADGKIMKIHTTTDSFKDLIHGFFSGVF